jgi:hypothetical protein
MNMKKFAMQGVPYHLLITNYAELTAQLEF